MARKQVHLLMPEELHALVKAKADDCGVSLTAYVLSVLEKDLNTQAGNGSSLASLALRVRAIEVHLGLDSRQPGVLRGAAAAAGLVLEPGELTEERRRSTDAAPSAPPAGAASAASPRSRKA